MALAIVVLFQQTVTAQSFVLSNAQYRMQLSVEKINVALRSSSISRALIPQLFVTAAASNPQLGLKSATEGNFPHAAWKKGETFEADFFKAAHVISCTASSLKRLSPHHVKYLFPEHKTFTATLDVFLSPTDKAPLFKTTVLAKEKGYYSVAFAGIEAMDTSGVKFLYQPLVWSWRRFPSQSYLTPESYATTAAAFTNDGRATEGLCPDASEIPYRFADWKASRFGLLLRNAEGKAQPMVFAPLLGTDESLLQAGQRCSFSSRYVLHEGDWYAGTSFVLRDLFGYKNERRNNAVTLNATLDNMLRFAMNDVYGGWVDSLKAFDYVQDAVGTVKIVSALHQLGAALVTGNEEIYRRRALPTMEYAMSREKYLFTTNEEQKV